MTTRSKAIKLSLCLLLLFSTPMVLSQTSQQERATIEQALKQIFPSLPAYQIRPLSIGDFYEVLVDGHIIYIDKQGDYFFVTDTLIDLKSGINLSEVSKKEFRIDAFRELGAGQTVRFVPKKTKYIIYVFTDTKCGYCRRFHRHIDTILGSGIEVRYLFAPFQGEDSLHEAEAIWCSRDRLEAMTRAKRGQSIPRLQCKNPIDKHLEIVRKLNIRGTPNIVLSNGTAVPGFVMPQKLLEIISKEKIKPLS